MRLQLAFWSGTVAFWIGLTKDGKNADNPETCSDAGGGAMRPRKSFGPNIRRAKVSAKSPAGVSKSEQRSQPNHGVAGSMPRKRIHSFRVPLVLYVMSMAWPSS